MSADATRAVPQAAAHVEAPQPLATARQPAAQACLFLMQLGGPEGLDDIEPFLANLFADVLPLPGPLKRVGGRLIAHFRTPKVRPLYQEIGGGSPILANTRAQGQALARTLAARGLPCVWQICMRYAPPFAQEAVAWARAHAADVPWVAVSLYPQYSYATSRTGLRDLEAQMTPPERERLPGPSASPTDPAYLDALATQLGEILATLPAHKRRDAHVLFSAHGLPMSLVREGDPYPEHIAQTVQGILARLSPRPVHWTLSYQSRVGPVKWLEPATDRTLAALGELGVETVVVVPVAFVSEHIETLHELDIELRHLAGEVGIKEYLRVPTVGCHPRFIDALADNVAHCLEATRRCCGHHALCERRVVGPERASPPAS